MATDTHGQGGERRHGKTKKGHRHEEQTDTPGCPSPPPNADTATMLSPTLASDPPEASSHGVSTASDASSPSGHTDSPAHTTHAARAFHDVVSAASMLHEAANTSNGSEQSSGSCGITANAHNNNGDIPNDPGKMFIGGLSWQTTPESIREYFSMFGELAEVMVMKDPATRRSRGFGFITFSEPMAVEKVLSYPVHQLDGKVVEPKVAVPRKTNPKLVMRTKKIFVGGISATTSLEDVRAYFEQFSKVRDAMLAYDKITNRHRGFGFVTFDNDEVVDKICEIHFHEINGKMVESKKALPKEPRLGYFGYGGLPAQGGFTGPFSQNGNQKHLYQYGYGTTRYSGNGGSGGGFYGGNDRIGHFDARNLHFDQYYGGNSGNNGGSRYESYREQNNGMSTSPMQYRGNGNHSSMFNTSPSSKFQQQHYMNERNYNNNNSGGHSNLNLMDGPSGLSNGGSRHLDDFPPLNNNSNGGLENGSDLLGRSGGRGEGVAVNGGLGGMF